MKMGHEGETGAGAELMVGIDNVVQHSRQSCCMEIEPTIEGTADSSLGAGRTDTWCFDGKATMLPTEE